MILPLIVIFSFGAMAALTLAWRVRSGWIWVPAALNVLIALHEISFAFRPVREWIRIDLLLTLPLFTLMNVAVAIYAVRNWRQIR